MANSKNPNCQDICDECNDTHVLIPDPPACEETCTECEESFPTECLVYTGDGDDELGITPGMGGDDLIQIIINNLNNGSGGDGCGCIIETTFDNFENIFYGDLGIQAGAFYLITDFETIYDQPDYSDRSTPKTTVVTKTGGITPILVLATSTTSISKEAWMPSRPDWEFRYDMTFTSTEYMGNPAKGRITWAKDPNGNETYYDHGVVLLKRYINNKESGIRPWYFWDTSESFVELLTFGSDSYFNKIGASGFESGYHPFIIGNNVLGKDAGSNNFGNGIVNNTFGEVIRLNTFGGGIHGNIFHDYIYNNTFGNIIYNNNFKNNTLENNFANSIQNNYFKGNLRNNTFGNNINLTNFAVATHVYNTYLCELYKRPDGQYRLRYMNDSDTMVVTLITD